MSTWQEKLKEAIGPRGYENSMRRSLQSVVLYEAKRCIAHRLASLRPFQRKAVFMDQAIALLESLDFMYPHQKAEVLWRTASAKEIMDHDVAWKREKSIEKEMGTLAKKIKPFVARAKTHDEAVNMMIQELYESLTGFTGKPFPPNWEHAHNHCIMGFRMYFKFDQFDSDFPVPISPRDIIIPSERPQIALPASLTKDASASKQMSGGGGSRSKGGNTNNDNNINDDNEPHLDVAELLGETSSKTKIIEERRKVLAEVREHLELLKEFEGIISEDDLAKRKRELFMALPPAPPPATTSSSSVPPSPGPPPTPPTKKIKTSSTPVAATTTVTTIPTMPATPSQNNNNTTNNEPTTVV